MLGPALIRLQPREAQSARDDVLRERARRRWRDTAAPLADVDLDEHIGRAAGAPCTRRRGDRTPRIESTAIASLMRPASAATRVSFAASITSLLMKMSAMPASASTSASLTFCAQTPTAPAAICAFAIAALLCILACGRSRTPCERANTAIACEIALHRIEVDDQCRRRDGGDRVANAR